MGSAAEAECGGLYMNAQEAVPFITTLEELGHKQDAVPIKTDNNTAEGIMNNKIKQKMSNAMDKQFYWVHDRCEQGQFRLYWAPGAVNLADYFSKYHLIHWYQAVRPIYCYIKGESPASPQGCVEILKQAKHRRSNPIALLAQTITSGTSNDKPLP